jgi:hypothetical protein
MIEPGIFAMAHSKGIGYLTDLNHDGNIDSKDLNLALAAKKAAATSAEPKETIGK